MLTTVSAQADIIDDAIGNIQRAVSDAYKPDNNRDYDDSRDESWQRQVSDDRRRQYDDRRRQFEDRRRQLDDRQRRLDQNGVSWKMKNVEWKTITIVNVVFRWQDYKLHYARVYRQQRRR